MKIYTLVYDNLNSTIQVQVENLFNQLSPNKKQLTLIDILKEGNPVTIVCCEENDEIVGIATMCNYRVISGNKGWIEDVVVDAAARGKGAGLKMIEKLIEIAKEKGLSEVLLFTEQHRVAAISLYGKLGFTAKNSQIYHLLID
jgi:ribosomal protein S18 acetylase RimI-like enzyme